MNESQPVTLDSVLRVLAKERLVQLGRSLDAAVRGRLTEVIVIG